MFSHGILAGLMFAVVGRMVYDRTHTRDLAELQRMNLNKQLSFAAVIFTIASVASMGLPGFSGFVAELQVLIGAWQAFSTLAVLAGFGILISVAYALRALQQAFFSGEERVSSTDATTKEDCHTVLEPISVPERIGAVMLIATSLFVGLYPRLLLDLIAQSFSPPLFEGFSRGGVP